MYLERADLVEAPESDVTVIVLDIAEGFLVVLNQRVNVGALPLLDLVDLGLAPQVLLLSLFLHLLLICCLDFCRETWAR